MPAWVTSVVMIVIVIGLFALWDRIFCGGRYCERFVHRRDS